MEASQEDTTGRNENERRYNHDILNLDLVLSTQPELGPSIPDGGYGWVVFMTSLFFQATIPCLIINFGMFLAFSKLINDTETEKEISMKLWDDKLMNVPLFFCITQSIFDSPMRSLISKSTWPQLVATSGTCLTCAGLVFTWMGMTRLKDQWLFTPAGLLTGLGSSILLIQCEVLVGQYFRLKLNSVNQISQLVAWSGFVLGPIFLGQNIMKTSISHVLLWYQAIILQGLILSIFFRKPRYMKSKFVANRPYQSVAGDIDEEEDIFSKNSRELQNKRQVENTDNLEHNPSTSSGVQENGKEWETFEDEEEIKYVKLNNWEKFEGHDAPSPNIVNNNPLSEELRKENNNRRRERNDEQPAGLFSDFSINNNNSYAYDDEIAGEYTNSNVFMPNVQNKDNLKIIDMLKEPTFYKTFMMICTNRFSVFIFYALFPTYLFLEINSITLRNFQLIIGCLCLIPVAFQIAAPWINVSHNVRPVIFWIFCWMGTLGYFMISDFKEESIMLVGAAHVLLSMCTLQHVTKRLHTIAIKTEVSLEYTVISIFVGILLLAFLTFDAEFKDLFRFMAIVHFFIGTFWLSDYVYKKLRSR